MLIAEILVMLLLPLAALKGAQHNKILNTLGPVVLCYILGIGLRNLAPGSLFTASASTLSEIAVPLSIPLLLFGQNLLKELRQTGQMLLAFSLAALSVGIMAPLVALFFRNSLDEVSKLAGMLVGVYTGGTPNLASIGLSLKVSESSFLLLTAADTILGGIYLFILLSILKPLLKPLFPKFINNSAEQQDKEQEAELWHWPGALKSLLLSALIVGASAGFSMLFTGKISVPIVMLLLTTLGLGAALWKPINQLRSSYQLGEYLILVFCISIGSQIELTQVGQQARSPVLVFCALVMVSAIVLHLLLARLLKLDLDTTLLASTAAIYGPAFVGVMAEKLQRRELIGPGLAVGVLGYAVGNYLGLAVAYSLAFFI